MKEVKEGREIETLPRNFQPLKNEFQKLENMFLARNKVLVKKHDETWLQDEYENDDKSYALLWVLMQELRAFFDMKEGEIIEKLIEKMGDKKEVFLKEYGKKVFYDPEAKWFFQEDISKKEWQMLDKEDNEKYLAERKSK